MAGNPHVPFILCARCASEPDTAMLRALASVDASSAEPILPAPPSAASTAEAARIPPTETRAPSSAVEAPPDPKAPPEARSDLAPSSLPGPGGGVGGRPAPPPPARAAEARRPARPRVVGWLALLAVVAALVALGFRARPWLAAIELPVGGPAPAPVPAPAVSPGDEAVDALVKRVGAVAEPRNLLLAQAWRARSRDDVQGLSEAVRLAERAVARSPADAESLALLAELYAETDREMDLRIALLSRAARLHPSATAPIRARAWIAWIEGRDGEALADAQACLDADPQSLPCAVVRVATADPERPAAQRVADADALLERWPEAPRLRGWAALRAAEAGLPDGIPRLLAALRSRPQDRELRAALVRARLASGDLGGAEGEAEWLGSALPPELAIELARALVVAREPVRARRWLDALAAARMPESLQATLNTLRLQALVLSARAGDAAAWAAAATRARELLPTLEGAGAAQAAMLACAAVKDWGCVGRAWDQADPQTASPRDRARLLVARASAEFAQGLPRDADTSLEAALAADPRAPEGYLLGAASAFRAQDPERAVRMLGRGVRRVDGSVARRSPSASTLPVEVDAAELRALADQALPEGSSRRAFARAAVAWLAGDVARAYADLGAARAEGEAAVDGLRARLLLARGDPARALAAVDAALAVEPGEPAWHLVRAEALVAAGDGRRAADALRVVKSAGGLSSLALSVEAEAAALRGEPEAARAAARAAVEADPDDAAARALLARLGG